MAIRLTPAEVASALDAPERLAAVEHLKTVELPTAEIEQILIDLAAALGGDPFCAATYLDGQDQSFIATSDGPMEAVRRQVSHCQYVIATGSWLCLHDASVPVGPLHAVRRAILRNEPIAAYLGFQLLFDGQPVGAVCAADIRKRTWTPGEHFMVYQASATIGELISSRVPRLTA